MEKPLSEKAVMFLVRKIFGDAIRVMNISHKGTSGITSDWLYSQPSFSPAVEAKLNTYLRYFGYKLAIAHRKRNSLLCFRHVNIHDDMQNFIDRDRSIIFIPLVWHQWSTFHLHPGTDNEVVQAMKNGSIVIFDQNSKHQVKFPLGASTLKYGLSFLLDRLEKEKPTL